MRIERQTLADAVLVRLRAEILNGDLVDGQELNQVALAQRFDVSRVPVREALQRLIAEGLVMGDPYRRVVVATVTPAALQEMLSIREELEVFGLRRLILEPESFDARSAHELNRAFKSAADDRRRMELDLLVHASLMRATPVAAKIVADIRYRSQRYIGQLRGGSARWVAAYEEHAGIIAAVSGGDEAGAIELLTRHTSVTRDLLVPAACAVPGRTPDEVEVGTC
jgi:DNA-binding GntR family transcriptional regulator